MKQEILETLNEWIGEMMVEKTLPEIHISADLETFLKKRENRQFTINSLINVKKNFSGSANETTTYLYEKLDVRKDSVKKLHSRTWYLKARGIYELYMMNQHDYEAAISEYTNSPNEYVRMEAQTAIVGFSGFGGLVFLSKLTYPLHEWQQIKLLEQLAAINADSMGDLPLWLQSSNDYVVQFALKLADIYQQFHVHDRVIMNLGSENEKIRYQAIKTLGKIGNETTAQVLKHQYSQETRGIKLEIIQQLAFIAGNDDLPFLVDRLKEEEESLVVAAGRAIITNGRNNWPILEEHLLSKSIFKQIKQEFS